MQYESFTPHQFEPFAPYVDTLLLRAYTPVPLDVAVPYGAPQWICEELARRILDRFTGRMAALDGGYAPIEHGWDENWLCAVARLSGQAWRFGLLLADRLLTREMTPIMPGVTMRWLGFDWWQWVRSRVPATRWPDAWLYLAAACPGYVDSAQFRQLGLPANTASAMRDEGRKLFAAMADALCERIVAMWNLDDPSCR